MNPRIATLAVTSCITLLVFLSACSPKSAPAGQQSHTVRGVVREVAPDRTKAVIRHEAIPNFMAAMTMEFNVRDTNELNGVSAGDTITFRLTADSDTHWIDQVRKISSATDSSTPTSAPVPFPRPAELKPGDHLPDFDLIAENGKAVRISSFRGKALAFTFFFTRCPLPDYCPRMSKNFAEARELILAMTNAPTNWQFLSISFDPEFDKPAVLSGYANAYRQSKADRWLFVAASAQTLAQLAPQLDLMINREAGGGISHNLRTVVLDPRGRIHRQFDGNLWTPKELTDALLEAAREQTRHP